jgi:hypothetical protein
MGTNDDHVSRLLAESGKTVYVVGQMWARAEKALEERCAGKLIIHWIPFEEWTTTSQHMTDSHRPLI